MSDRKRGACSMGIDLGGSSVKSVAVSDTGEVLLRRQLEFDALADRDWAGRIVELVEGVSAELGGFPRTIGLAAPGLASRDGRSIAFMPGRLGGLEGLDWTSHLRSPVAIPVLNDAHAALLGEAWKGAARGLRNVILITLGTGVGGAAMVDGRLLRGEIGRAGHLGHASLDPDAPPDICGTPGSLELAIGNCTIEERTGGRFSTTHDLVESHLAGDAEATRVWLGAVRKLAAAIASYINSLDPAAVIVGGGIARSGDALFVPLTEMVRRMEWRPGGREVLILPAELGEFAGALGAAWRGMQPFEDR
ncbi:MAG: ROK family protein [Verrucomicrobia bacterium]|nr:ROK family protein [Verrucomicrobiota bacterium]